MLKCFFFVDFQEGASQFQQQAVKLKRKYWWENIKVKFSRHLKGCGLNYNPNTKFILKT